MLLSSSPHSTPAAIERCPLSICDNSVVPLCSMPLITQTSGFVPAQLPELGIEAHGHLLARVQAEPASIIAQAAQNLFRCAGKLDRHFLDRPMSSMLESAAL
jgi:hypothetical protein